MAASKDSSAAEPKKGSKKFKIVIIIVVLLLLMIGGAVAFWWFQFRDPAPVSGVSAPIPAATASVDAAAGGKDQAATDIPRPTTTIVPLPSVMVNLADAAGNRYLKLSMEVEVSAPEAVQEIQSQQARIRDAIIILLSSKSFTELSTAEGKMQLKNEVASRLNQILGTPRVVRIYFTDFVVQ